MARRTGVTKSEIHAVWWGAHEMVTIRDAITIADRKAMQQDMAKMVASAESQNIDISFNPALQTVAMILRMVIDWTLTDGEGNRIPFNEKAVLELPSEDADFIVEEITNRNKPLTKAERDAFLANAKDSSSEK